MNLVGSNGRGVRGSWTRMRKHLRLERCARHAGSQNFRYPRVLIAEPALQVLPLRIGGILRRIQRIKRNVA